MKTSNKHDIYVHSNILFALLFYIQFFRINKFSGEWCFTVSTIVYSIGIILGLACLIMYLFLFCQKVTHGE